MPRRSTVDHRNWLWLILSAALSTSCSQPSQPVPAAPSSPSPTAVAMNPLQNPPVVVGKPYPGTGIVTLINLKEGWLEIDHEPIEGLMPAMQMEWTVEPRSLMRSIRVGDKVNFTVVETGKGEIITEIRTIPKTQ